MNWVSGSVRYCWLASRKVELSELLRLVQFYNSKGHAYHVHHGSEDGFAPGVYAGGGN